MTSGASAPAESSRLLPETADAAAGEGRHWLTDWYRYLDQVSRPVRKGEVDESDTVWRPWRPEPAPEEEPLAEALRPEVIPLLDLGLGSEGAVEAFHPATAEFEDPTIYDELRPSPSYDVPVFRAPTIEFPRPRYPSGAPAESAAEIELPPLPALDLAPAIDLREVEPVPEAAPASLPSAVELDAAEDEPLSAAMEEENASLRLDPLRVVPQRSPKSLELLRQIRDPDVAQNSYKGRFQETREELLQRLLDPLLTLEETSRLLGVCPTTVRRYTNKGALKHLRTQGNQRRFRLSDVLEFLESRSSEIEEDARADREAGRQ